ncbi:MAG TPA: phospholipid carrier-dependent glycosyltransferase [Candidatus Binataceae bacterium]|nr:phospholipid carrier-dependent glycosyltransferase [Candidatus Binataceae bacterium]
MHLSSRSKLAGGAVTRWYQILSISAIALASLGAADPSAPTGKVVGFFTGTALLALVVYATWRVIEPLIRDGDESFKSALMILAVLWLIKTALLTVFAGFGGDVASYQAWAATIAERGPAQLYQEGYFLDYPPGYLYALWVAGIVVRAVGAAGDTFRIIVESPALVADFALAAVIFAYVRSGEKRALAFVAMLMVALNPALLFDTVVWGQSDSVLSFVMILEVAAMARGDFEIAWGLAAISVLVKPQGLMILPALGLWTLFETDFQRWVRCGVALVLAFVVGIAPFQIGHKWNWILNLYGSTAAYYHETSVNAFNFMALVGGLRRADSDAFIGVSYFTFGMGMLVPLYAFTAWLIWKIRSTKGLWLVSFLALFGFFLLAPRMHERYLYPALVFSVPLAIESTEMMVVFGILTVTCLFNLAYIKHTLETIVFLNQYDTPAMIASMLNVGAFAIASYYAIGLATANEQPAVAAVKGRRGKPAAEPDNGLVRWIERLIPSADSFSAAPDRGDDEPPPAWTRIDTIVVSALVAVAAFTRFWHLGTPPEIVFDEVHFVGQARHYLHNEYFLDPHPPLAKVVIMIGLWLFGDHSWAWRFGNATIGTALVAITYMLARRIIRSRIGAALAAGFVLCDGLFLVDSRYAVIDIVYITCASVAYLLLFRFIETKGLLGRRKILPWIGVALGLCLGSKLYIPAITCLLVAGFLALDIWRKASSMEGAVVGAVGVMVGEVDPYRERRIFSGVTMVACVTAAFYLVTFAPHFLLGWWGGISDLFAYYKDVIWYEGSVSSATHPYASVWWTWPLMLRPVAYWQRFPKDSEVIATVWGGGNPLIFWGALTAITITAIRALERRRIGDLFLVIGYFSYLLIWAWIGRTLFLYHYMASVYLGFIALAAVLSECWENGGELWEHVALLLTMVPAFILGLGSLWGAIFYAIAIAVYVLSLQRPGWSGKYVTGLYVAGVIVLFVYFYPVWTGMDISKSGYYARMWLQGPGIRSWI